MKFFRKIRQSLIAKHKLKNYILYAIGEIILVMIGILLALQVNNWNDQKQLNKNLISIVNDVKQDLIIDTTVVSQLITFYETKEKNSIRIIDREINRGNYKECPECISLVTFSPSMSINTKGYNVLKDVVNNYNRDIDSLKTTIVQFYNAYIPAIEKSNARIEQDALNNIESFKEFSWFVDWTKGSFNEDMILYFTESEDYRKKVAAYNILATTNHLAILKNYKVSSIQILDMIEKWLKSEAS